MPAPVDEEALARILVVEDERIVARDLADTLATLGYAVIGVVATGEDAIERCRIHRPNVVLMDIRLEGAMDGIEAAARIRAAYGVPVIFLTAHADDGTLRRATQTEPVGYLVKPFRVAELRCAIEIAIHRPDIDARLRAREEWIVNTWRSIGDGVAASNGQHHAATPNRVAEALIGWNEGALGMPELRRGPGASPVSRAVRDHDEIAGDAAAGRDAGHQRRMEDEIRSLNAELERRVAVRTEQLEIANKELESFSYSVAHDLRAPLRGIDGYSQALIEDHAANLGPDGVAQLHRVRAAAQRMRHLIDDLLQLARVAKQDLQRQPVDLSRLAHVVTAGLRRAHPERTVEVAIQGDIVVDGDERLLLIVLENLLGNAWKFTSKAARAAIEVGVFSEQGERGLFIRDNGAGFDMVEADRLFGAFQRLHPEAEFEGTGVGLVIVQRIVHRHGGRIWAESAVGEGSTFYFVL